MSYSCNDNQNYFVKEGKTTSRVLAPPGGKTSICLGWEEPEPPVRRTKTVAKQPDATEKEELVAEKKEVLAVDATKVSTEKPATNAKTEPTTKISEEPVSNNVFAASGGGNVITGRPSSRVLAPPGGKSSIVLG